MDWSSIGFPDSLDVCSRFCSAMIEPFNHLQSAVRQHHLWGLINLLPIYPLDGGQISRELFTLRESANGIIQSLQLSAGAAVLVAAYALSEREILSWHHVRLSGLRQFPNAAGSYRIIGGDAIGESLRNRGRTQSAETVA